MTPTEIQELRHFTAAEFRHPELIVPEAARFLDLVRDIYGQPLLVTSDARTPEENAAASGSSPNSLHLQGRAFDLRMPETREELWKLVEAVHFARQRPGFQLAVELELVHGPTDHHVHVGVYPDPWHPSVLELNLT